MNVGSRGNRMRSREASKPKRTNDEGKSVRFSRQMISDIFFIERLEKKYVKELFYSEKDIIGFQIDAMRKGERKARRARERARQGGVARSNSDGKVETSSRRDSREEGSPSKGKKSKKSSKKRSTSKDTTRRRFSNDDAPDYEPRTGEDSSRRKSRDPLADKRRSRKSKSSNTRRTSGSSSSSDDSAARRKSSRSSRESMTQEQLLEKAMHWRKSTNYKEAGDKLDNNTSLKSSDTNTAIDPWTQDMLMTKAKKWGEAMANKVAASNPERRSSATSSKTKQMAFQLARDAKDSCSTDKVPDKPRKQLSQDKLLKEPPTKKPLSSNAKQFAFLLARDAKEGGASNGSLEELPLSDDEDDDVSVELSDLVMEANMTESMNMSQNDFLAEAIEKKQKEEEAANPLNKLRGIVSSIMVTQTFQNLTMETESSK